MRRRIRRKHRPDAEQGEENGRRLPTGMMFTVVAVLVLLLVLGYDQREQKEAKEYVANAEEFVKAGQYEKALEDYKQALDNKRLSKKARAKLAISIGDLYYDHFEDYQRALTYYVRAKQLFPESVKEADVSSRMETAQLRARGAGTPDIDTTTSVIMRVELLSPPLEDRKGKILARFDDTELRSGEIERIMRSLPSEQLAEFKVDGAKFEEFVHEHLDRALLYQAAVDANLHRDPDVSVRLYDYQRNLLSERYERALRDKANIVKSDEVVEYYNANKSNFVTSGTVTLAMIKTDTQEAATSAVQQLHAGIAFGDVAEAASTHKESKGVKGVVGTLQEGQTTVPGVGENADLAGKLLALNINDVTSVIPVNDSFYIFKILAKRDHVQKTLDEVRAQIEATLRGQKSDRLRILMNELKKSYSPDVDDVAIRNMWEALNENHATTTQTAELAPEQPVSSGGMNAK